MADLRDVLRQARIAAGYETAKAFADAAGLNERTYRKYEDGTRNVSRKAAPVISRLLKIPVEQLIFWDARKKQERPIAVATNKGHDNTVGWQNAARDVPIVGSASVGGTMQIDLTRVVAHCCRPPGLAGALNVYAIYVWDASMAPRYMVGELIYVHPDRPVTDGDHAVICLEDGACMIRRVVSIVADAITVEQYSPPERVEIPAASVTHTHRICTTNDLAGA